jgi:hypothetical protein
MQSRQVWHMSMKVQGIYAEYRCRCMYYTVCVSVCECPCCCTLGTHVSSHLLLDAHASLHLLAALGASRC